MTFFHSGHSPLFDLKFEHLQWPCLSSDATFVFETYYVVSFIFKCVTTIPPSGKLWDCF